MIHSKCVFAENRDSSYFGHDRMGLTPSSCHTHSSCTHSHKARPNQDACWLESQTLMTVFWRHVSVNCSRAIMESALRMRFINHSEALHTLEWTGINLEIVWSNWSWVPHCKQIVDLQRDWPKIIWITASAFLFWTPEPPRAVTLAPFRSLYVKHHHQPQFDRQ